MCKRATPGKGVFFVHICELCVYFVFAVLKILAEGANVAGYYYNAFVRFLAIYV